MLKKIIDTFSIDYLIFIKITKFTLNKVRISNLKLRKFLMILIRII